MSMQRQRQAMRRSFTIAWVTGSLTIQTLNQVVQAALQVEIAHTIIQELRKVRVGGKGIQNVVGVGHSGGSSLTLGIVGKYPCDFDGLVFSGISASITSIFKAEIAFNLLPAALDPSGRFRDLDYGYLTQGDIYQAFQFPFYRYPHYDPISKLHSPPINLTTALTSHPPVFQKE